MGGKGSGPVEKPICRNYLMYWVYVRGYSQRKVGTWLGVTRDTIGRRYRAYGLPSLKNTKRVKKEDRRTPPWPKGSAISEVLQTFDQFSQKENGQAKIWPLVRQMRRENK